MASIGLAKLSQQHHGQSHNMASIELAKLSQQHLGHSHNKDNKNLQDLHNITVIHTTGLI